MDIQVEWDDSQRLPDCAIIVWTFPDEWDWNDFAQADKQAFQMALDSLNTVHSIVDFRQTNRLPHSGAISYFTRSIATAPPNRGIVAVVSTSRLISSLETILRALAPKAAKQYVLVKTLDEAYTAIAQYQDSRRSTPESETES